MKSTDVQSVYLNWGDTDPFTSVASHQLVPRGERVRVYSWLIIQEFISTANIGVYFLGDGGITELKLILSPGMGTQGGRVTTVCKIPEQGMLFKDGVMGGVVFGSAVGVESMTLVFQGS